MAKLKLRAKDLRNIGFEQATLINDAISIFEKHYKFSPLEEVMALLKQILADPDGYSSDPILGKIADKLIAKPSAITAEIPLREDACKYHIFGEHYIDESAKTQMYIAAKLPIAVTGALMPDAHHGYGLPIGGVLATDNAVIPYGVGVDIGCRMCLSIFDIPEQYLRGEDKKFKNLLHEHTLFGTGKEFQKASDHEVLYRKEFDEIPLLKGWRHKAAKQLGSSGSGNHFVEFGIVTINDFHEALGIPMGRYIGLLSHSGSRGLGANIANHYTHLAMQTNILPTAAKHLAWLSLDSAEGMEYWLAMNLAGDYASACHHAIHDKITRALGVRPLKRVENHHNFAWKEQHLGRELIVHRKGATPASEGVLGIIPGSMTAPGYIVVGKGNNNALASASHGAGRQLSRTKALKSITHSDLKNILKDNGVTLIGGSLDEAPQAYKDINEVMQLQQNLVMTIASFQPKIVIMDAS